MVIKEYLNKLTKNTNNQKIIVIFVLSFGFVLLVGATLPSKKYTNDEASNIVNSKGLQKENKDEKESKNNKISKKTVKQTNNTDLNTIKAKPDKDTDNNFVQDLVSNKSSRAKITDIINESILENRNISTEEIAEINIENKAVVSLKINPKIEEEIRLKELKARYEGRTNRNRISASISETQSLKNGEILRFITNEESFINGVKIPKNTYIYGKILIKNYRALINISSINVNETNIGVNMRVYGNDGGEGIAVSTNNKNINSGKRTSYDEEKTVITGDKENLVRTSSSTFEERISNPKILFLNNQKVIIK